MTFQGYTEDTRAFFMALRFNNNREFFLNNREWYLRSVREPSLAPVSYTHLMCQLKII